jgi:hypothetical protein
VARRNIARPSVGPADTAYSPDGSGAAW